MKDLLARLECASEGNEFLDGCIALLVGDAPSGFKRSEHGDYFNDSTVFGYSPPAYSTSLDAALTLVPPDARVRELGQWWDINRPGGWFCNIMRWERDEALGLIECCYTFGFADSDVMPRTAPTAAIALCIAALRARAVSDTGEG